MLEADGRRSEARAVLEKASQSQPENARLWFERGSLALRSGDIAEAVAAFDRATLAAPQDAVAYHSLRFAFEGYRRFRAERVRFEPPRRPIRAMRWRTTTWRWPRWRCSRTKKRSSISRALSNWTRVCPTRPVGAAARCSGWAMPGEAETAYANALEIDPGNAEAQRSLVAVRSQRLLASPPAPVKKPL